MPSKDFVKWMGGGSIKSFFANMMAFKAVAGAQARHCERMVNNATLMEVTRLRMVPSHG